MASVLDSPVMRATSAARCSTSSFLMLSAMIQDYTKIQPCCNDFPQQVSSKDVRKFRHPRGGLVTGQRPQRDLVILVRPRGERACQADYVRGAVGCHSIADDPVVSSGQQIGRVRRQLQATGGPPELRKNPPDRERVWIPAAQEDQAVRPEHGCGGAPHPAIPLEQSTERALFQCRVHGVLVEVEAEPATHELAKRWCGRRHSQMASPACDGDDKRLFRHQARRGHRAFGWPDFLAGHADFLIQHPERPGPVKPARAVNQKLVHENARLGYWPRSQRPGAMSSRASAGPHDPGAYGTTMGGLASSGAETSHTADRPSGRVNSDRSPSSTSWMSRT